MGEWLRNVSFSGERGEGLNGGGVRHGRLRNHLACVREIIRNVIPHAVTCYKSISMKNGVNVNIICCVRMWLLMRPVFAGKRRQCRFRQQTKATLFGRV